MFSRIYCAGTFFPLLLLLLNYLFIYIEGIAGWHKPGTKLCHPRLRLNRINTLGGTNVYNQSFTDGPSSRPETYDFEKCATFVPSIMLIPQLVGMDLAISPKTGQRKTWLLRKNWMPQNRGPKKWNPQAKKVKSALRLPEKRIADGFGSPQKSGIRSEKLGVRKRKPGSRGSGLCHPGRWTDGIMPCLDVMNH